MMSTEHMTLKDFFEKYNNYHNLYIVRDGDIVLYIGISKDNIYNRWFARTGPMHV